MKWHSNHLHYRSPNTVLLLYKSLTPVCYFCLVIWAKNTQVISSTTINTSVRCTGMEFHFIRNGLRTKMKQKERNLLTRKGARQWMHASWYFCRWFYFRIMSLFNIRSWDDGYWMKYSMKSLLHVSGKTGFSDDLWYRFTTDIILLIVLCLPTSCILVEVESISVWTITYWKLQVFLRDICVFCNLLLNTYLNINCRLHQYLPLPPPVTITQSSNKAISKCSGKNELLKLWGYNSILIKGTPYIKIQFKSNKFLRCYLCLQISWSTLICEKSSICIRGCQQNQTSTKVESNN